MYRDIKIDKGDERMKPKVICSNILRSATPSQVNPIMADTLVSMAKTLLASKENAETTPAPNAYRLPTFTDDLNVKVKFSL